MREPAGAGLFGPRLGPRLRTVTLLLPLQHRCCPWCRDLGATAPSSLEILSLCPKILFYDFLSSNSLSRGLRGSFLLSLWELGLKTHK